MNKRMSKLDVTSKRIWRWIVSTIAKPNPQIGNFPVCPFINRYKDHIMIVKTDDPRRVIDNFVTFHKTFALEAVVCHGFDFSYEHLHSFVNKQNRRLKKKDIICLGMHPDTEDEPLGFAYTYRNEPLIIIQKISTLEHARKSLENTDYYTHYKE